MQDKNKRICCIVRENSNVGICGFTILIRKEKRRPIVSGASEIANISNSLGEQQRAAYLYETCLHNIIWS